MKDDVMDIVFVLDRSGSMYGCQSDTIGGFNSIIEKQKEKGINARVTTVLFNNKCKLLYKMKDLYEVEELTEKEYYVRGSTALLDAVGKTITDIENEVSDDVLFVITTDGYENASREYTRENIKKMIENHDWEFLFLGADIDAYGEAGHIGISQDRTARFNKSADGFRNVTDAVDYEVTRIRNKAPRTGDWKRNLE